MKVFRGWYFDVPCIGVDFSARVAIMWLKIPVREWRICRGGGWSVEGWVQDFKVGPLVLTIPANAPRG